MFVGAAVAHDEPGDWPSYNRTLTGDRHAPQTEVTPSNAHALRPVCSYGIGRQTSLQTGPIVVGGVIYFTTDFDTIALDASTCALKWRTTERYEESSGLKINRGAALIDGRLVRGTQDGRVLAYDARTGKRIWETRIGDTRLGESVPAALIAWQGLVFAGNGGGDNKGVKGRMTAIDSATGRVVWEQFLVPRGAGDTTYGPPAPAASMPVGGWGNTAQVPISGGASWTSYSLDPATGTLYVPGGNPAPDFVAHLRAGLNPFAGTLVALDARTGGFKAAYPLVERDFHDWDVSAAPAVVTTRGGVELAAEAIKNGRMYGIDTSTGKQLWQVETTSVSNALVPLGSASTRFCPGAQGGTQWNGPSYSAATNLLYVGAVDWCTTVTVAPDADLHRIAPGQPWGGGAPADQAFGTQDPVDDWAGWITAVDADTGRVAWKRKLPAPVLSGITSTAGGVVFGGDIAGHLYAFDATTGDTVWQRQAVGALGGGIVSYTTAEGRQRIAVAEGMSSPIWPTRKVEGRLVVYGLK
ncbi:MAG: glucose dehydrogenase [Novosphingobium sp.]|nr:glucose dehydrogenase [Novosphingobium sp.]